MQTDKSALCRLRQARDESLAMWMSRRAEAAVLAAYELVGAEIVDVAIAAPVE